MKKNEVIQVNVVERIVVLTVIPGSYKMMVNDVKTVVGEIWRYPKNQKKNRFHSIPFSNIPTKSHNSKVSPMFFHGKPHGFPHPRPSPPVPRRLRHAAPRTKPPSCEAQRSLRQFPAASSPPGQVDPVEKTHGEITSDWFINPTSTGKIYG